MKELTLGNFCKDCQGLYMWDSEAPFNNPFDWRCAFRELINGQTGEITKMLCSVKNPSGNCEDFKKREE